MQFALVPWPPDGARVTSVKSAKGLLVSENRTHIDRTPGTPGSDKNLKISILNASKGEKAASLSEVRFSGICQKQKVSALGSSTIQSGLN